MTDDELLALMARVGAVVREALDTDDVSDKEREILERIERQVDAVVAGHGQGEMFKLAGLHRLKDDFDAEEWAGIEAMTDAFVREQAASLEGLPQVRLTPDV